MAMIKTDDWESYWRKLRIPPIAAPPAVRFKESPMKSTFPSLSTLFGSWAAAGQYGEVAGIDVEDEEVEVKTSTVRTLPTAGRKKTVGGVQHFGGNVGEPKYIDGSMLVKRKIA
jgi:hypothetical protein